jgi:hypothetical protein
LPANLSGKKVFSYQAGSKKVPDHTCMVFVAALVSTGAARSISFLASDEAACLT